MLVYICKRIIYVYARNNSRLLERRRGIIMVPTERLLQHDQGIPYTLSKAQQRCSAKRPMTPKMNTAPLLLSFSTQSVVVHQVHYHIHLSAAASVAAERSAEPVLAAAAGHETMDAAVHRAH